MADEDGPSEAEMQMRRAIMAIMMDTKLTDAEKSQKRQELMCGGFKSSKEEQQPANQKDDFGKKSQGSKAADGSNKTNLLEDTLKCVICFNLCERPVTGPCQHNCCLACFKRWIGQGKKSCPTCRAAFPAKFCENPRINTLLTYAIRCAKQGIKNEAPKSYNRIADESRPAEAFTTERAVRNGRANAASGRIMVNVPNDQFGPILPEHDPTNGKGVQVGDWWRDRLDCRQWGAHFPHVAGIAGQSNRGAQSVVLSGGYEDDHDEGEWFLYTGSGGRDLSGNKRTNKTQSFDQEFENMNKALKISCLRGLPVRVVRSFKEKRSSYAPSVETPVRYDGIYRILRCWRKAGAQGFLMCRYLFVRCDNSPAPWTSEETGDAVRLEIPELAAKEIKAAKGTVFEMADAPYWDFDEKTGQWGWAREAPPSQKAPGGGDTVKQLRKKASAHERLLKDFSCGLCKGVLENPLSMPCGHNFCKGCLNQRFAEQEAAKGGSKALAEAQPARSLRVRKVHKPCPTCKMDITDYMAHAAVNTEMAELIRRLQEAAEAARKEADNEANDLKDDEAAGSADDGEEGNEDEHEGDEQADEDKAGPSTKPPQKKGRVASGKAAVKAGAKDAVVDADMAEADAVEDDTPAAEQQQQQPAETAAAPAPPPAAAAAAAAPAAVRYPAELSQLCESFPEFDGELIAGMLEDQGGDVDEVHAYLKRMKNQLMHAKRTSKQQAAGASSPAATCKAAKGKGKGGGRGKRKQAAATAEGAGDDASALADAAAGAEEHKQDDADAPTGTVEVAAAVAKAGDDNQQTGGDDAAADTQPESDAGDSASRKAAAADKTGKAAGSKSVAAAAAADGDSVAAAGKSTADAAETTTGSKKRRQAAAGSGRGSKRAK